MMKFKHEDLEVWQLGMELTDKIYELFKKYPEIDRKNLGAQLLSSATSIPLNIAEGSERTSKKDFARYLRIAKGSLLETDTNVNRHGSTTETFWQLTALFQKALAEKSDFVACSFHSHLRLSSTFGLGAG